MIDKVPGPLTQEQERKVFLPGQKWDDDFALKTAVLDFNLAEQYRTSNLDLRWGVADQLYLAWVQTKYWEGTRVPRANIGVYTAFEQIESMLPRIVGAIFADYPNWFQCDARLGTSPDEARAVSAFMLSQMENMNQHGIQTVREVFRRAFKSGFIYGNGIIELCWLSKEERRWYAYRQSTPEMKTIFHPVMGPARIPTGRISSKIVWKPFTEKTNQPYLRNVSIKDFYIDPNCQSPIVSDARYCAIAKQLAVDEIASYRDVEGFSIPSDSDLVDLARQRPVRQGDFTKSQGEANRQMWWQPQIDSSIDPAARRIEVIQYMTRDRLVWMANRSHILLNQPNPFGFIPVYDLFYCDVLDRFYGLAVTDVTEGEQRLQQSIINARIDELALSLNKPLVKKKGVSVPAYQLKVRPGQVIEVDNPQEDIVKDKPQEMTRDAYLEVQASDIRVQKITGGSDLAILGTPSSGGNSANRTATGVGAQVQATGSRVQYQVENAEDTVIEQILSDWHTLNQRFINPEQIVQAIGQAGQLIKIDPLTIINARVKLSMRASAKMASRQALAQNFPLVLQTLMNPGFMQQLAAQGKAINFVELEQMLFDMLVHQPVSNLIRDMTPQEQQRMMQPPPTDMLHMQMQRERIAGQKDVAEDKHLADLVREILKGTLTHHATQAEEDQTHLNEVKRLLIEKAMDHHTAVTTAQIGSGPENEAA